MLNELDTLKRETAPFHFVETIKAGKSVEGRDVELFRVTDAAVPETEKKHFALIAGQHSPQEMLGAHFLRPMIDFLSRNPMLLKKMTLHFVPIVNMDCAYWGSSGSNLNGENINRCWESNIQPENRGIRDYFLNLKRRGINLDVFLDLHAGGTFRNHPIFFHSKENWALIAGVQAGEMIARQESFLSILEKCAGIRASDSSPGGSLRFGKKNSAGFFQHVFSSSLSYTLELSTSSYFDPLSQKNRMLDQRSLAPTGEKILRAFLEYVKIDY